MTKNFYLGVWLKFGVMFQIWLILTAVLETKEDLHGFLYTSST